MKNKLILLFCCISAFVNAQITSSGGQVYLSEDGKASYLNPDIYVAPQYYPATQNIYIRCIVSDSSIDYNEQAEFALIATKAELDGYTGSGTGDTEKFVSACQKFVVTYLESITANAAITFTP